MPFIADSVSDVFTFDGSIYRTIYANQSDIDHMMLASTFSAHPVLLDALASQELGTQRDRTFSVLHAYDELVSTAGTTGTSAGYIYTILIQENGVFGKVSSQIVTRGKVFRLAYSVATMRKFQILWTYVDKTPTPVPS
jgi:hypothetical protein